MGVARVGLSVSKAIKSAPPRRFWGTKTEARKPRLAMREIRRAGPFAAIDYRELPAAIRRGLGDSRANGGGGVDSGCANPKIS
jgi:hypothetical protein